MINGVIRSGDLPALFPYISAVYRKLSALPGGKLLRFPGGNDLNRRFGNPAILLLWRVVYK